MASSPNRSRLVGRGFGLRAGSLAGSGFLITVAGIVYTDARIQHVIYGVRVYPHGYAIAVSGGVLVWLVTVFFAVRARTRAELCIATFTPSALAVAIADTLFGPEYPHLGVTFWCLLFATNGLIAAWIRGSRPRVSFLRDTEIPLAVRIEAAKGLLLMWQGLAFITIAGIVAALAPWTKELFSSNQRTLAEKAPTFILDKFAGQEMIALSLAILIGPVLEVVSNVLFVARQFKKIREGPSKRIEQREPLAAAETAVLPTPPKTPSVDPAARHAANPARSKGKHR